MSRILAVASGKGGVGKTFLACSIGHALAQRGLSVLLFDADLGLANVDIQLGVDPKVDLGDVLRHGVALESAVETHPPTGLQLVVGRSGCGALAGQPKERLRALAQAIARLAASRDVVLLDLAAGVDSTCRYFATLADEVVVVTTDEPTALTDAYAFVKVACGPQTPVSVVVNNVEPADRARETFDTLARACRRFLDRELAFAGAVRRDPKVAEAIRSQTAYLSRYPNSAAADDIRRLARSLARGTPIAAPQAVQPAG